MFARQFATVLVGSLLVVNFVGVSYCSNLNTNVTKISDYTNIVYNFIDAYDKFITIDGLQETPQLNQATKKFSQLIQERNLLKKDFSEYNVIDDLISQITCHGLVQLVRDKYRQYTSSFLTSSVVKRTVKSTAKSICNQLGVATNEMCENLVEAEFPTIDYILQNTATEPTTFCSLLLEKDSLVEDTAYNWSIDIDDRIDGSQTSKEANPNPGKIFRILQLSDFHYDPDYVPGSLAECVEPQCCRNEVETYNNTSQGAGYWADYRQCDIPWHLIDDSINHIVETHSEFDYIYFTGDIIDHMVWGSSKERNSKCITQVMERLRQQFNNTPIYSCIGNHESHPVNQFSPPGVQSKVSTKWLYEHLYEESQPWLPESTKETLLKGGYYTVSPKPGFRVIVLNSNECSTENWWFYFEGTNKKEQLQWFYDTLLAAEQTGEYVHVLTHIPSGDKKCWHVWSREYNRIIARFSKIIGAIFNGHSHDDEFFVHYNSEREAMAVTWNGGSMTTYEYRNPNYKIYQVEDNAMQVVDFETWIFNVTEANLYGSAKRPRWYREYSFSEFSSDLSPVGLNNLLEKFTEDSDLLFKFWQYKSKSADPTLYWGCNEDCMKDYLCRLSRTVNNQNQRCIELRTKMDSRKNKNTVGETTDSSAAVDILASMVLVISAAIVNYIVY